MKVHSGQKLEQLIALRKRGYSITELVNVLGMPKTTVWHHVQKVKVPKKYIKLLKSKQGGSKRLAEQGWINARASAAQLVMPV